MGARTIRSRQSGQVVVEYALLLVIGIAIWFLITTTMFSRDPNSPGFMVQKWHRIIAAIGADTADDLVNQ